MSLGNTPVTPGAGGAGGDRQAVLFDLVRRGASFSGHERHCAFLNLVGGGDPSFADVSWVSGLDFADDGRAAAFVDWDGDGDLDLWVANRSGPQLRFLENRHPRPGRSLRLKLVGSGTTNRDAVGARAEVVLPGERPLWRSVRAGDAFLSQGSKWLHFGLGEGGEASGGSGLEVQVRWPGGGKPERFSGLRPGRSYVLTEAGGAAAWTPPAAKESAPGPGTPSAVVDRVVVPDRAAALRRPLPLPPLTCLPGGAAAAPAGGRRATLLLLWASWCQPCLREMEGLTAAADELRAAGVDVLALCVDGVGDGGDPGAGTSGDDAAARTLGRLGFPFRSIAADERSLRVLEVVDHVLFERHRPLPLPCSFLLDGEGRLTAVFKGAVSPPALLSRVPGGPSAGALPFPGRWHRDPVYDPVFDLARALIRRGLIPEASAYILAHQSTLSRHPDLYQLLVETGSARVRVGDRPGAIAAFEAAIRARPAGVEALNNLAFLLAEQSTADGDNDAARRSVQLARRAAELTGQTNAAVLDTLAASLAASGDRAAATAAAQTALSLAIKAGDEKLAADIRRRLQALRDGAAPAPH